MNVILVIACVVIAGAAFVLLSAWHRRRQRSDLGSLSPQWMAEQKVGRQYDSNR